MRNKGSKDAHGRYSSIAQMQKRSVRLADAIDLYATQAYRKQGFNNLVDFDLLEKAFKHLDELAKLKIDES